MLVLDDNNDTLRKYALDAPRLASRDSERALLAAACPGYTWGLDLSGSVHGAGGIGGLLGAVETQGTATTADDKSYWYLYDANGNVAQILDATDTQNVTRAAHYEYDPYGNTIVVDNDVDAPDGTLITANGGYAHDNPIRFSTKWLDDELADGTSSVIGEAGLYYFRASLCFA